MPGRRPDKLLLPPNPGGGPWCVLQGSPFHTLSDDPHRLVNSSSFTRSFMLSYFLKAKNYVKWGFGKTLGILEVMLNLSSQEDKMLHLRVKKPDFHANL